MQAAECKPSTLQITNRPAWCRHLRSQTDVRRVNLDTADRVLQKAGWAYLRKAGETGSDLCNSSKHKGPTGRRTEGLEGSALTSPRSPLWTLDRMCQDPLSRKGSTMRRSLWEWNQEWARLSRTDTWERKGKEDLHQSRRREHSYRSSESSCGIFEHYQRRQKRELYEVRNSFLNSISFPSQVTKFT